MSEHAFGIDRRTFLGGAAVLSAAFALHPNIAFGETAAEKQAEADAVLNQLVSLQADLEQASNDYYGALEKQQAAETAMEEEQAKIDDATTQISDLQTRMGSRANTMYREGPTGFLDFVLGSATFSEFTQSWDLLNSMNEDDAQMVEQTRTLRQQLQDSRDEYARQEQVAAQEAAQAEQAKNEANALVAQAQESYNTLSEEAKQLLEQEQAAAAAAAALQVQQSSGGASGGGSSDGGASGGGSSDGGSTYYDGGSSDGGSSSGGGSSTGEYSSVVGYATSRIGCPYVWGAEGPDSFDCSGLVVWAYRQIGVSLPHQTESLYACASNIVPVSEARPGDVLYRYGHVGIAEAYGGVPYVHAPTFGAYVRDTDDLSWSGFTCALQF